MKNRICEVKESPIHGMGLFALCDIKEGSQLFETHIMDKDWVEGMPKGLFSWINLLPNCMYNHSKTKFNCTSETEGNRKFLVATRDIKKGDEILTDYTEDPDLEQPEDNWKVGFDLFEEDDK
jgi:SET domain-containing protein